MFSINTNLSAMAALESLNTTAADLNVTQNRISTGKKVSSAADNPAVFSISNSMSADLAGLSAVSDNLAFGQSTVSVAMASAAQISSQLSTLKQTVTQAQQQGLDPTTMQNQVNAIVKNIDQIASSASFNGVNLLDGSSTTLNVIQDIKGNTIAVANQNATAAGLGISNLATNASAMRLTFDNTFSPANGDTIDLSDGTDHWIFEFSDGSAPLTSTPTPTTKVFDVQVDPSTQSNMQMVGALIDRLHQQGFGATLNSDGTLDIAGNNITTASSAVTVASGGATASSVTGPTAAITMVDSAIQQMNTKSATLGAASQQVTSMQDFSNALKDSLTSGLGALTDADMAAESAKLQSLQTKQQLAIQALSIANQQPQMLMSLFR